MEWYTTDLSTIGTYTIRITATSGCCANNCALTSYKEFNLIVTTCETDILTISSTKFPTITLTYNIKSTAAVHGWSDYHVTSAGLISAS